MNRMQFSVIGGVIALLLAGCTPPAPEPTPSTFRCVKTCRNAGGIVVQTFDSNVQSLSQEDAEASFDTANACPAEATTRQIACTAQ